MALYILLGNKQEALKSDMADALNDIIDHFDLTVRDHEFIIGILDEYSITYEE